MTNTSLAAVQRREKTFTPMDNSIEVWFSELNWEMQRRVVAVAADGFRELPQVMEYFPLPWRENRQWVFPIKGECDPLPPEQLPAVRKAIRRYLATRPSLKRAWKPAWTDIKLKAAGK